MPRKPRQPPTEDRLAVLPPLAGTSMLMSGETTDERRERELEEILIALGGDTQIKVYHIVDGKPVYAGSVPAEGFTLDTLMDAFGGGDKALVFFQGKDKKDTARVSLDPSVPIKSPRASARAAAAGTTPGIGDLSSLIAAMAQSSMAQMQMMSTVMASGQNNMTMLMNAVTAMMAANKGTDPMEMAVRIGELMKSNATGSGAKELLEVFEKGMSIRDKLGGDEDGDGVMDIASKGLDIVGKLVSANGPQNGQRPMTVAPRQPPQLPTPKSPSVMDELNAGRAVNLAPPSQDRPWVAAARPSFPLLSLSIGNVKPETAVDVLSDRMTDDAFDDLVEDIETGTPDEFIARFESYFAVVVRDDATRQWFKELIQAILASVEPEPEPTTGG